MKSVYIYAQSYTYSAVAESCSHIPVHIQTKAPQTKVSCRIMSNGKQLSSGVTQCMCGYFACRLCILVSRTAKRHVRPFGKKAELNIYNQPKGNSDDQYTSTKYVKIRFKTHTVHM